MKTNSQEPDSKADAAPIRLPIRIAAYTAGLICVAAVIVFLWPRGEAEIPMESAEDSAALESPAFVATNSPTRQHAGFGNDGVSGQRAPLLQSLPEPPMALRLLVTNVVNPERLASGFTPEQTAAWKEKLHRLVEQGAGAVPAIREFLARNVDFDFGAAGKESLGYESARVVMIDALAQIGGPLAIAAISDVLRTTAVPREIALLAQHLAKVEPDLHAQEACDAARQTLAMAAEGGLAGRDVAPLFQVLQKFGDASVAAELTSTAERWNYYAAIALARLPEENGVPALVRLATGQAGPDQRIPGLQMLAQVAAQSTEARTALIEQARENRLSAYDWATIVPILAGDQMVYQDSVFENYASLTSPNDLRKSYVSAGNQSFYAAPLGAMTLEQVERQKALIDELASVTTNPAAAQALERSKALLSRRLPQTASTGGIPR